MRSVCCCCSCRYSPREENDDYGSIAYTFIDVVTIKTESGNTPLFVAVVGMYVAGLLLLLSTLQYVKHKPLFRRVV